MYEKYSNTSSLEFSASALLGYSSQFTSRLIFSGGYRHAPYFLASRGNNRQACSRSTAYLIYSSALKYTILSFVNCWYTGHISSRPVSLPLRCQFSLETSHLHFRWNPHKPSAKSLETAAAPSCFVFPDTQQTVSNTESKGSNSYIVNNC